MPQPRSYKNAAELADELISMLGKTIVLGLPIGVGKATHIVDALFRRAVADPSISLTIFSGLTLATPRGESELQSNFVDPLVERLFADWPTPAYVEAVAGTSLPANIAIREFYLRPGAYLGNEYAQQNYTSINYSQVVDELMALGVNVIAQLITQSDDAPNRYSLSSNPEITLDLLPKLEAKRCAGAAVALVGQVNRHLPYMYGDSELSADQFDLILDSDDCQFRPFGLLNRRVTYADYATGMHVASLIPDGGTLQLGIGSLSDAVAHCLRLRHDSPDVFRAVLDLLPGGTSSTGRRSLPVEDMPFEQGLYASTELLSDAVLALFQHGLIKRAADEDDDTLIHAGFFVGSKGFFDALNEMPPERRRRINMTCISYVNTLFGDEARKRHQRRHARLINETMMATLLGEAVSDTLSDGRVVSGVGGQFDFVSMAQALEGAHSILMLRASRVNKGTAESNIRWSYGSATVPRHHRDIYVTEYGIAATRGRTDAQVIDGMLRIADSAFQASLMAEAKNARKLASEYQLDQEAGNNSPQVLRSVFAKPELLAYFPDYPLGTVLTAEERQLIPALEWLQDNTATASSKIRSVFKAVTARSLPRNATAIERAGLSQPSGLGKRVLQRLLRYALTRTNE